MTEMENEHDEIKEFLKENKQLLEENNKLLKKIHKNAKWTFWVRVIWYGILLGLPFAIYFAFGAVFSSYFEALGSDYGKFQEGMRELPGLKNIDQAVNGTTTE